MQDCLRARVDKSAACLDKVQAELIMLNPQLNPSEKPKSESLITISAGALNDLGNQMLSFNKEAKEIAEDLTQITNIISKVCPMPTTPATNR
jgi:hypothetical protein